MDRNDAYAAGLLDGEGCIYVQRNKGKSRKEQSYTVCVRIGMTQKAIAVLERMQDWYGGKISKSKAATKKWDAQATWSVYGLEANQFLEATADYLALKKRQAELALMLWRVRLSSIPVGNTLAKWDKETISIAKDIQKRIAALNAKGPDSPRLLSEKEAEKFGATLFAQAVAGEWLTYQRDLFHPTGFQPLSGPFPQSGMGAHGVFWTVNSSAWPSDGSVCSLSDVLETCDVPRKYYLSPTACRGILRRAASRGRELPKILLDALTQAATAEDSEPSQENI